MIYLITSICGFFAGTLSGFFGIGGGVVFVPTLLFILRANGYAIGPAMLIATGTSLGAIVLSTSSAAYRHKIMGNIRTETVIPIIIGVVLTSAVGVIITNKIGGAPLRYLLAAFNIWAAYRMFKQSIFHSKKVDNSTNFLYNSLDKMPFKIKIFLFSLGMLVGVKSSMLGIGGGVFVVAALVIILHYPSKNAAGTSALVAFTAALIGVFFRGLLGTPPANVPSGTIGTINIPLALTLGLPAMLGAQLGAGIHKKLKENKWFYIAFGILLVAVTVKMFW
ncbi:sulfite exporter TauE/SafE family protein [bacterium]|nr:sulfite exporter TauE/SafE family protein [bacterium]